MAPITLGDLLPIDEYRYRREGYFRQHMEYVERGRRVRFADESTLVFENRRTLWFRVMERISLFQIESPEIMQAELDGVNLLLPDENHLQAALLLKSLPPAKPGKRKRGRETVQVELRSQTLCVQGTVLTGSNSATTAHWVEWTLTDEERAAIIEGDSPFWLEVERRGERTRSNPLTPQQMAGLAADLAEEIDSLRFVPRPDCSRGLSEIRTQASCSKIIDYYKLPS